MTLLKSSALIPSVLRNTLLDDWFKNDTFLDNDFFSKDWTPAVNIIEKNNEYEVEMVLPGMNKEDIQVHAENGILQVKGESKSEKEEKDRRYTRREFSHSSFERSFRLPENADEDDIKASYHSGILRLEIKKTHVAKLSKKDISIS
jgi:HSP20 family protein